MTAGERFADYMGKLGNRFGKPVGDFLGATIAAGVNRFSKDREPEVITLTTEYLTKIKTTPGCPPELSNLIDKALTTGDIGSVIFGWMATVLGVIPQILGLGAPLGRAWEYSQDRLVKTARFDPSMVITAWRRDPEKYLKLFEDLKDQGWDEDRIEALKFLTLFIPSVQDVIRFGVREVYTKEVRDKFKLEEDFPPEILPDAGRVGLEKAELMKYWGAHWELPSSLQGFEMLRRGVIDEETLKLLLRTLDVMPFWRDKLLDISWEVPTRVDVRRFWDMRTIDEARLREIYTARGYHGKDLEDYVLWTKIYTDFPDLLARFKNGWITLDQVKSELIAMGMKPERADTMIEEKIKKAAPERVAKERDLTAAEIIKGVKKEVITPSEGIELLMDMGYDEAEAGFKLAIEITALAGSPESFAEFKDLTQKYRKASGLEGKPMNEEIRKAAAEVIRLTGERDSIQRSITEEQRGLIGEEILPAEATARLNKLKASLRKAGAALSAAKTEYDRLVAEGKYT